MFPELFRQQLRFYVSKDRFLSNGKKNQPIACKSQPRCLRLSSREIENV